MVKSGLGRGLSALIPQEDIASALGAVEGEGATGPQTVPIGRVRPNPAQPRRTFNQETLAELADSVRRHGIIQPILVESDGAGGFTIVAGERRWRAATIAGLNEVPIIARTFTDEKRLEIAIIENVQREDLNPVEEAQGYRALMDLTGVTQEEIAARIGKSRSAIANAMRILKLPDDILESVKAGEVSPGHARTLLSVVNPSDLRLLYDRIKAEALSVRATEKMAQDMNKGMRSRAATGTSSAPKAEERRRDPELAALEQRLIEAFGTKVTLTGDGSKGTIIIEYFSQDDLERIHDLVARSG